MSVSHLILHEIPLHVDLDATENCKSGGIGGRKRHRKRKEPKGRDPKLSWTVRELNLYARSHPNSILAERGTALFAPRRCCWNLRRRHWDQLLNDLKRENIQPSVRQPTYKQQEEERKGTNKEKQQQEEEEERKRHEASQKEEKEKNKPKEDDQKPNEEKVKSESKGVSIAEAQRIQIPLAAIQGPRFPLLQQDDACLSILGRAYTHLKLIARSDESKIYIGCQLGECKYVIKVSTRGRVEWEREQKVLRFLQDTKQSLDGAPIAPRLYDAWECKNKFYQVLEEFDSDMRHLGKTRMKYVKMNRDKWSWLNLQWIDVDKPRRPELLYYRSEIAQVLRLAIALGRAGIIHGDLKLNQFLQRDNGRVVRIADFDFSTIPGPWLVDSDARLGWPGISGLDCPPAHHFLPAHTYSPIWMNLWQLTAHVTYYSAPCLVIDDDTGAISAWIGISDLRSVLKPDTPTAKFCASKFTTPEYIQTMLPMTMPTLRFTLRELGVTDEELSQF